MRFTWTVLPLLVATLSTATLVVESGALSLVSSLGTTSLETAFSSSKPSPASPKIIQDGDTLRLSFVVTDAATGDAVQPNQAVILWEAQDAEREYASTVKVRKGGKGKFELDFTRAPTSLLSVSTGPVSASLVLGDAKHASGLQIPLGTFTFSSSLALPYPYPPNDELPKGWEVERYSLMPEIHWTFKEPEKPIAKELVLFSSLFMLLPWVVLNYLLDTFNPRVAAPTVNIVIFLLCFILFEVLISAYWINLKLLPTLPYFGLMALLTAYTGRKMLVDMRKRRLAWEAKDKKSE